MRLKKPFRRRKKNSSDHKNVFITASGNLKIEALIKRELKKENRSDSKIFEEKCCNQKSLNCTLRAKKKLLKYKYNITRAGERSSPGAERR